MLSTPDPGRPAAAGPIKPNGKVNYYRYCYYCHVIVIVFEYYEKSLTLIGTRTTLDTFCGYLLQFKMSALFFFFT